MATDTADNNVGRKDTDRYECVERQLRGGRAPLAHLDFEKLDSDDGDAQRRAAPG